MNGANKIPRASEGEIDIRSTIHGEQERRGEESAGKIEEGKEGGDQTQIHINVRLSNAPSRTTGKGRRGKKEVKEVKEGKHKGDISHRT